MNTWLFWLIPPLAGAFIGFLTNVLAIRMLFRPLKAVRIFGIRLPFTPGVLPRERCKLADSIGRMVERELLTPEILRERFADREFREKCRRGLAVYAGRFPVFFSRLAEEMYPLAWRGLIEFLYEPDIHAKLEAQGHTFVDNTVFMLPPLQRLLVTSGRFDRSLHDKMPEIIDELIQRLEMLGGDDGLREEIISYASDKLFNGGAFDAGGGEESLENRITEKLFMALESQAGDILKAIDVRSLVSRRIDSLDMLRVEGIILDVMADQFKWIDIFGGLLGFCIGLFQVLFSRALGGAP
jgi:F0F1-type ATP synthase assembly protein I